MAPVCTCTNPPGQDSHLLPLSCLVSPGSCSSRAHQCDIMTEFLNLKYTRKNGNKYARGWGWWRERVTFRQQISPFLFAIHTALWAVEGHDDACRRRLREFTNFFVRHAPDVRPALIQLGFWRGSAGIFKSCLFYAMWPNVKQPPPPCPRKWRHTRCLWETLLKEKKGSVVNRKGLTKEAPTQVLSV